MMDFLYGKQEKYEFYNQENETKVIVYFNDEYLYLVKEHRITHYKMSEIKFINISKYNNKIQIYTSKPSVFDDGTEIVEYVYFTDDELYEAQECYRYIEELKAYENN